MQALTYQVPGVDTALDAAALEARARRIPGVISALYVKEHSHIRIITSDKTSSLKVKAALYRGLMQSYFCSARDVICQTSRTLSAPAGSNRAGSSDSAHGALCCQTEEQAAGKVARRGQGKGPGQGHSHGVGRGAGADGVHHGDDIAAEFEHHKKSAIFSLLSLGAFELLRRFNPTLYASTTLLRSALVLFMSRDLLKSGIAEAFKERRPNAETLTVTAIVASVAASKPESSLSLLAISHFAEGLTTLAAKKARKNISDLVSLDTQEVWLRDEKGFERKVPVDMVRPGMIVSIHDGEKICVDGEIIRGQAAVDQAAITGESIPVSRKAGDRVFAGSTIRLGDIEVRVDRVGDDTSIARIVHMVEDAQNRRAPVQNYADRIASALVPVSFIAAGIVYLVTRDLQRVLNMLFIDFSCGLKLSTATAMSAAISRLAQDGVLVKGGSFIEQAASVDTVVLDKTGTITRGRPEIVNVELTDSLSVDTLLSLAASAEAHSSHPMAIAILEEAARRELEVPHHIDTTNIIARGIEAQIGEFKEFGGGTVLVGSRQFMVDREIRGLDSYVEKRMTATGSLIYVAANGVLCGVIESSDPVRPDFRRALNRMRYSGIEEIVMLTGDNEKTASRIAASLGLDSYKAEVMPEDKAGFVAGLQRTSSVLMVGDGINDAPALAYADVGVAMGTSCTDTAMETADVTINSEDPLKLPEFIALGKRTMRIVQQNFAVTIAVNAAAMTMGALGFINPLLASIVHNASTLGVVLNSTRVLHRPRPRWQPEEQNTRGAPLALSVEQLDAASATPAARAAAPSALAAAPAAQAAGSTAVVPAGAGNAVVAKDGDEVINPEIIENNQGSLIETIASVIGSESDSCQHGHGQGRGQGRGRGGHGQGCKA